MTTLTITPSKHSTLLSRVERAAKNSGVTPEAFVLEILTNYFKNEVIDDNPQMPGRLKKLRGSLSALREMDIEDDARAMMILNR